MPFLIVGACFPGQQTDAIALKSVFSILKSYEVREIRNHDSCRAIDYSSGSFSTSDRSSCVQTLSRSPQSFQHQTDADFQQIWDAIAETGIGVEAITDVQTGRGTLISSAKFHLDNGTEKTLYFY